MGIESINNENRVFYPNEKTIKKANISGMDSYHAICKKFANNYEESWGELARELLIWKKPFTKLLSEDNAPFYKWFEDGKINASYNCLDRHLKKQPNKIAFIFEGDDGSVTTITYKELYHRAVSYTHLRAHET